MELTLKGRVNGKRIVLDRDLNLPPGTEVTITIDTQCEGFLSSAKIDEDYKQKLKAIHDLCGVWANDKDIEEVFEKIRKERNQEFPREINLDETH